MAAGGNAGGRAAGQSASAKRAETMLIKANEIQKEWQQHNKLLGTQGYRSPAEMRNWEAKSDQIKQRRQKLVNTAMNIIKTRAVVSQ